MTKLKEVIAALLIAFVGLATSAARGQDYLVTASGPLLSVNSEAKAFNGSATTTLPDLLDVARLQGGSFRATYRFTPVTPEPVGTDAFYELSPTSGMISYELLDANGLVVHRGTNPSEPIALLENNSGSPPFSVDQVVLASGVNDVTGLRVPAALYSPSPYLSSSSDFNFAGNVGNGTNYLNDLAIPTDATTYLAFPIGERLFGAYIEFGDGDYMNRSGPYQHASTVLQYEIAAVNVSQVPEPATTSLLAAAGVIVLRRRGRQPRLAARCG